MGFLSDSHPYTSVTQNFQHGTGRQQAFYRKACSDDSTFEVSRVVKLLERRMAVEGVEGGLGEGKKGVV